VPQARQLVRLRRFGGQCDYPSAHASHVGADLIAVLVGRQPVRDTVRVRQGEERNARACCGSPKRQIIGSEIGNLSCKPTSAVVPTWEPKKVGGGGRSPVSVWVSASMPLSNQEQSSALI